MNGHLLPMNRPRLLTMNNGAGEERHEWGNLTTWGTMYARGRVLSLKVEALRAVAQLLAEHLTPKKARPKFQTDDPSWLSAKKYFHGELHGIRTRHLLLDLREYLLGKQVCMLKNMHFGWCVHFFPLIMCSGQAIQSKV